MATLTLQQAATYARAAGFTGDALVDIVAVVPGESGGSTTVVNSIGCVGVWQINQPVHVKDHPGWTVAWLQDPANNATAAKTIFDSQGMAAWEVWTNGTAAASLPAARAAVASIGGASAAGTTPGTPTATQADLLGSVVGGAQDVGGFLSGLTHTVIALAQWMGDATNWLRVGQVVVGGGLVLIGLQALGAPVVGKIPTAKLAAALAK